mgnify:CR=1 FL=1
MRQGLGKPYNVRLMGYLNSIFPIQKKVKAYPIGYSGWYLSPLFFLIDFVYNNGVVLILSYKLQLMVVVHIN